MMEKEIVITGFDLIRPICVGQEEFWTSLRDGVSGIGCLDGTTPDSAVRPFVAAAPDFHAKDFVKPRKNIKVMSRDIQLGFVAAMMAVKRAGLNVDIESPENRSVEPERLGVIFGCDLMALELSELADAFYAGMENGKYDFSKWGPNAMTKIMPLWMLKYLPNMPASHIGIAMDARGASNSPTLDRVSSLASIIEAAHIIQRGDADVMVCGGTGNRSNPCFLSRGKSYRLAPWTGDPQSVPRPFDAGRVGTVNGEGSGALVIESKQFALARGAKPLATLRGYCQAVAPTDEFLNMAESVERSIAGALKKAGMSIGEIDHINADGLGTVEDDAREAVGIKAAAGDTPVFTGKGHFGTLGSGTGAVELAASLIAMEKGTLPPVRNCEKVADDCPINVITKEHTVTKNAFVKINQTNMGRSTAVVIEKY